VPFEASMYCRGSPHSIETVESALVGLDGGSCVGGLHAFET
jgi:hypothetical protein